MSNGAKPISLTSEEPWLEVTSSRNFQNWLERERVGLAFSTYQAGKIFLLGRKADGQISVFERTLSRCMGLCATETGFWLSSTYQVWRFENALKPGQSHQNFDKLFVPRVGYTTGDLDVHDIVVESSGRVVFVNTSFGCLATFSPTHSFIPLWQPPFLSKLTPEDRCHLNGLALENGKCKYVTVVSKSDIVDGWRNRRHDGGCILEVPTGNVVASGLSMPHSPRVYRGQLYVHDSGNGYFCKVDVKTGAVERVAFCPGYLRGLDFSGDYAIAGLSGPRKDKTFSGLALDQELSKRDAEPWCGLQVIELSTGNVVEWVRLQGLVTELYDVVVLKDVVRPMLLGFKSNEIAQLLSMDDPQTL
ncbi:MAG: TIGR03032 family protein [Gemmataceae bacterium]|nr:TIGR03032 family protein [Gemmataceae bacterium]